MPETDGGSTHATNPWGGGTTGWTGSDPTLLPHASDHPSGLTAGMSAAHYAKKQAMSAAAIGGVSAVGNAHAPVMQTRGRSHAVSGASTPTSPAKATAENSIKAKIESAKPITEDPTAATKAAEKPARNANTEDPKIADERARLADAAKNAKTPEEKALIASQKRELDIKSAPVSDAVKDELRSMYDKAAPAKTEIDNVADSIAAKFGGKVAKADLKGVARVLEKGKDAAERRGGKGAEMTPEDLKQIKDIARNTVVVGAEHVEEAMQMLLDTHKDENGKSLVEKSKVVDAKKDKLGYSGGNATVNTKANMNAEIQINSPEMIYGKEKEAVARGILGDQEYERLRDTPGRDKGGRGHEFYEEHRVLPVHDTEHAPAIEQASKAYYANIRNPAANPVAAPTA